MTMPVGLKVEKKDARPKSGKTGGANMVSVLQVSNTFVLFSPSLCHSWKDFCIVDAYVSYLVLLLTLRTRLPPFGLQYQRQKGARQLTDKEKLLKVQVSIYKQGSPLSPLPPSAPSSCPIALPLIPAAQHHGNEVQTQCVRCIYCVAAR